MNLSQTRTPAARNVRADAFIAQMRSSERATLALAIERQNVAELERAAIAGRIQSARKEAGLSQPEMAEALGVIPRTYQNYEAKSNPRTPWGLMSQIATVTGKTTEWLIHGDRTPDLFPVTEQLDGVSSTFSVRVDQVEAKLDRIADALEQTAQDQRDHDKRIRKLLDRQSRLLDDIRAIVGREDAFNALREFAETVAPEEPSRAAERQPVRKPAARRSRRAS